MQKGPFYGSVSTLLSLIVDCNSTASLLFLHERRKGQTTSFLYLRHFSRGLWLYVPRSLLLNRTETLAEQAKANSIVRSVVKWREFRGNKKKCDNSDLLRKTCEGLTITQCSKPGKNRKKPGFFKFIPPWSLTIFIDFDFYLLTTPASNYTRNWCYFERVADLNREKLGAYKPGQYRPSEEDFKAGFKEKISFFLTFY